MLYNTKTIEKEKIQTSETDTKDSYNLIVWNDEINTFEWVIQTLKEVCHHSSGQAQQCTLIIHNIGKCQVKKGTFKKLRAMAEAIIDRGIGATVE